jgi:hypothetical protein
MPQEREPIDCQRLNAICYTRALPPGFVRKYLLKHLSDDGKETLDEYMHGTEQQMNSVDVWNLLHRDDRLVLTKFLERFGEHKWRWIMIMNDEGQGDHETAAEYE